MFGTTLLTTLLAAVSLGAIDQQPTLVPAPDVAQLRISTPTYGDDGKITGGSASYRAQFGQPLDLYVYSGKSLCLSSSPEPATDVPTDAGFGWRLQILPAAPAGTLQTADGFSFVANWTRMWDNDQRLTGAVYHSAYVTLHPGERILLDYLNAPADVLAQLQRVHQRQTVADMVAAVDARLKELRERGQQVDQSVQAGRDRLAGTIDHSAVTVCNAIGMGLEISLDPPKENRLVETDLWLVHQLPDGTEQSQHQVLRTRMMGSTDYFFDALKNVPTKDGSVTITGKVAPYAGADGKLHVKLDIASSYLVNSSADVQIRGSSGYDTGLAPGEVLSFNLPVLGSNNGSMTGHKFSLRIRTTQIR